MMRPRLDSFDQFCYKTITLASIGFLPKAPGTAASLLTCLALFLLTSLLSMVVTPTPFLAHFLAPILLVALFFFSWLAIERSYSRGRIAENDDDPSCIVIDEVLGQSLTLWLIAAESLSDYGLAFIVFRFFDIVKPPPIDVIEQRGPRALGILNDDIAAAVFAFATIVLLERLSMIVLPLWSA